VSVLDRKVLRDLWRVRMQALTIALVVASGVACLITIRGAWSTLHHGRASYYEQAGFGHVFARAERVPRAVASRLASIPGVRAVEARLSEPVLMPLEGTIEPATGRVLSLPERGAPALGRLHLKQGRLPDPDRPDEVAVLEGFALAHGLSSGASLPVVMNGVLRRLRVVGVVLSPEYIFAIAPGDMLGDPKRFGVLWMSERTVAAAFRKEGAFDDVVLSLWDERDGRAVIAEVDRTLAPYGGQGASGRDRHPSDRTLSDELKQLEGMASVLPVVFLFVAAFLVNVVLVRMVELERGEIAVLKALGFSRWTIGGMYAKLVVGMVAAGSLLGLALGVYLGGGMASLYAEYFHLPSGDFHLPPGLAAAGLLAGTGAGLTGAMLAVRSLMSLAPAEAMRPPSPTTFRATLFERLGLLSVASPATRMVLREMARRPLRTLSSALGMSFAVAILVFGRFNMDVIDHFFETQFSSAQRERVQAMFRAPAPARAVRAIAHEQDVTLAEPLRMVGARLVWGHRSREVAITGQDQGTTLRRLLGAKGEVQALPEDGLVLDRYMADLLDRKEGDEILVEILEGDRPRVKARVGKVFDGLIPMDVRADRRYLARLLGEGDVATSALISCELDAVPRVVDRLVAMPGVAQVTALGRLRERFNEQTGQMMLTMTLLLTGFAMVIAVGVVYNNARVSLSSRARELGTLRVLGATRGEVSRIWLGQLAIETALAIPPGCLLGRLGAEAIASTVNPELFRFPVIIRGQTYVFAVAVVAGAALLSALLVRRRIDHLDLVEVLKTRELHHGCPPHPHEPRAAPPEPDPLGPRRGRRPRRHGLRRPPCPLHRRRRPGHPRRSPRHHRGGWKDPGASPLRRVRTALGARLSRGAPPGR
jgi:putative ABC transport system permease protein